MGGEGDNRGWDDWNASPMPMDMSLSRLQEVVMDRETWRAVVCGVAKSQRNWMKVNPWNVQWIVFIKQLGLWAWSPGISIKHYNLASKLVFRVVMILSIRKIGGTGFYLKYLRWCDLDFPGGPVGKDFTFQWKECRLDSLVGELKMSCALQPKSQNIKQKQYCNKFSRDFKK